MVADHQIPLTMSVARQKLRVFTYYFGYYSNTPWTAHYSFLPRVDIPIPYLHANFQLNPCGCRPPNTPHYVRRSPKITSFYPLFWLLLKYTINGPLFLPTTGLHPYCLLAWKFLNKSLWLQTTKYPSLCPSLAENYEFLPIILAITQIRHEQPIIPSFHGLTSLFVTCMQIFN